MKRITGAALLLVTGISGCVGGPETGGGPPINYGKGHAPPTVPGVVGPHGQKVAMASPYDQAPPASDYQARMMMQHSLPLSNVQMNPMVGGGPGFGPPGANMPMTMVPRGGIMSPPGIPPAPGVPAGPNIPGGGLMPPGGPGMMRPGGPGMMPPGGPRLTPASFNPQGMNPGVVTANMPPGGMPPGGLMPAQFAQAKGGAGVPFTVGRTQVKFTRPTGMKISWYAQGPDGKPMWSSTPVEAPGRYNFTQAAIYRLKLNSIDKRPGLELYPTLEVVPGNPTTDAFLAHSAVPIEFTDEDFKQVAEGNYIVKVIYLPYPQFQDVAGTGTDEILSSRLEPGADPIEEARRRGSILLVLRLGNVDQEAPNTPPLNAPTQGAAQQPMMAHPNMGRPNLQVPMYGAPGRGPMPGMPMLPPGMLPPGNNSKDAGKATTGGLPGGPLNVPSLPLPGAGHPGQLGAGSPPPLPQIPNFPALDNKVAVPAAPAVDKAPKQTPVAPIKVEGPGLPPLPTAAETPAPPPLTPAATAPMLPVIPAIPDAAPPGPQSRRTDQPNPTAAQLADQIAAPRR